MATRPFLTRHDVDSIDRDDELSAARLHLELQHQLDESPDDALSGGGEDSAQTRAALKHLHSRFPHAPKVARHETSERLGGLPRHLRTVQERERDEAGLSADAARAERAEHRARREGDRSQRSAGSARPRSARPAPSRALVPTRRARRRARRLGLTPTRMSGGWSQIALESFVTAVGLSLFYLLLTRGKAVAAISTGFGQTFAKVVSPSHDVFGGGGPAPKAAGFTLNDVAAVAAAGGDVTGIPVDVTGLPGLTRTPPRVPKVNRPRAPAHASPTRITTPLPK